MHRIFSNFAYILLLGMSGIVNGLNPTIFDGITALSPFTKMVSGLLFFYCL